MIEEVTEIEALVVITTIQPFLLAWVAAISFFLTLAITAMLSVDRRWHELVVIFGLGFLVIFPSALWVTQWIVDIEIIQLETIERMYAGSRRG